jgi:hypothetical protein
VTAPRRHPNVTTRTFKAAAAALGAALALPAFATVANAEPTDPDLLAQVSGYLVGELDEDTDLAVGPWGVDHGLSIDVLFALAATGAAPTQVTGTAAALAAPAEMDAYLSYGDPDEAYAGPTAKLSLALLTGGIDPTDVADRDLLAELTDLVTESGRISDRSVWGDYSSVITQSLAVLAFAATNEAFPDEVVAFLAADQCDTGGFTNGFGDAPDCTGDPDATSFALQALLAAESAGEDVGSAVADAAGFLQDTQTEDGVWLSADLSGEPVANANSTGLAAQAFSVLGLETDEARDFLASLQVEETCGLRYQASDDDADARATAQAVPALAEAGFLAIATGTVDPAPTGDATCTDVDDTGETDGGRNTDGGNTDGGNTDGGNTDGGNTDGGNTDGGNTDGGNTDGGNTDGGNTDGSDTVGDDGGDTDLEDTATGVDEVVTPVPDTTVAGETTDVDSGPLARTGSDHLGGLLAAAVAALLAGIGMTLLDRRRQGVV